MRGKALAAAAVGVVLAAGAFAVSSAQHRAMAATDDFAPALGSQARCAAYGGLPPGWGRTRMLG
jgi:hypothetical protein